MAIKNDKTGFYMCMFCLEEFPRAMDADVHQKTHDFVLVPLLKSEISNLILYLYNSDGNKELLSRDMIIRMRKMQSNISTIYD
jgi:hypothetical protein